MKKWFYITTQTTQGFLIGFHFVNRSTVEFMTEEEITQELSKYYQHYIRKKKTSSTWVKVYELNSDGKKFEREDLIDQLRGSEKYYS